MNEMAEAPDWLDENKVDEVLFCQEFLMEHPMVCVRGTFFTIERRITDERELKKLIYLQSGGHEQCLHWEWAQGPRVCGNRAAAKPSPVLKTK